MNHNVFGKKLSRTKNQRQQLFSNLVRSLILHGSVVTSKAKAKAVQPLMEKLVTRAKKGTDADRRLVLKVVPHNDVVNQLMDDAKDRFSQRTSGFTRMIKIGNIRSDGSEEVMLSFVDEAIVRAPVEYVKKETEEVKEEKKAVPDKKTAKKVKKPTEKVKK